MAYWLMKSEPDTYSWDDLRRDKKTDWDGVRNYQAANNMKAMKKGDLCFFYHSNKGKEIVGITEVIRLYHPDPSDKTERFGMVTVKYKKSFKQPVTLSDIKNIPALKDMVLIRQSRLSVSPVTEKEWKRICKMGGVES